MAAPEACHPGRHHGALHVGRTRCRGRDASGDAAAEGEYDPKDEETVNTIKELLETRVRPAVANDGGDITFHGFKDGIVYLTCAAPALAARVRRRRCGAASRRLLQHFCPDVHEVRPV